MDRLRTAMLGMSLFDWTNLMYVAAAFVTAALSLSLWQLAKISDRQRGREYDQYKLSATEQIEGAKRDAARANAGAAEAHKQAEEAKAEAARANERAAEANERARIIEERMSPRRTSPAIQSELDRHYPAGFAGMIEVTAVSGDQESIQYATETVGYLKLKGFNVVGPVQEVFVGGRPATFQDNYRGHARLNIGPKPLHQEVRPSAASAPLPAAPVPGP